jgi:hypothetical protein
VRGIGVQVQFTRLRPRATTQSRILDQTAATVTELPENAASEAKPYTKNSES